MACCEQLVMGLQIQQRKDALLKIIYCYNTCWRSDQISDLPYGCALYAYGKGRQLHVSEPFASYGRQDSEGGDDKNTDILDCYICHPCSAVFSKEFFIVSGP
jgi:hypothetical protein